MRLEQEERIVREALASIDRLVAEVRELRGKLEQAREQTRTEKAARRRVETELELSVLVVDQLCASLRRFVAFRESHAMERHPREREFNGLVDEAVLVLKSAER
jgi:hypothetical protein